MVTTPHPRPWRFPYSIVVPEPITGVILPLSGVVLPASGAVLPVSGVVLPVSGVVLPAFVKDQQQRLGSVAAHVLPPAHFSPAFRLRRHLEPATHNVTLSLPP